MEIAKYPQPSKRSILYYPTIDIPSDLWLRQAILYWDEVSSIVPKDHSGKILTELSPEVQYLMDEGQFKPIHPEELVFNNANSSAFFDFEMEFRGLITSEGFKKFLSMNYYGRSKKKVDVRHWSKIHRNKTSDSVQYELEQLGLFRNSEESDWHEFETNTALLYMSLLAKHLAGVQKTQTTIGTDYTIYEQLNFKQATHENGIAVVNVNLNHLLPVPQNNVPFEKILDFKSQRKDNLMHFRKVLLDYHQKLRVSTSNDEVQEITTDFKDDLILGINDLKHALKDSRITSTIKSVRSLINLQSPATLLTAGSLIANKFGYLPEKAIIPIAIVSGSIELIFNYIEDSIDKAAKIRDSPFSYVYHAQKAGILKPNN